MWMLALVALIVAVVTAVLGFLTGRKGRGLIGVSVLSGLAAVGFFLFSAVVTVPAGHVAVPSLFGKVKGTVLGEGLHLTNPLYAFQRFSVRRRILEFSGQTQIISISRDGTPLSIDAGIPVQLNGPLAWKVYRRIGNQQVFTAQLLAPAARSAVRDAAATLPWIEATTSGRERLASEVEKRFRRLVEQDLEVAGFSAEEAAAVFTILPVQLRKILPPQKVLNAVSEKLAAEEDLQKQVTLTRIAEEEAKRRRNEGRGVKNLFAELPKGFTPGQIREVLNAIADKTRAEALMKAVESGEVSVIVMEGGQTPAIAVPGGRAK